MRKNSFAKYLMAVIYVAGMICFMASCGEGDFGQTQENTLSIEEDNTSVDDQERVAEDDKKENMSENELARKRDSETVKEYLATFSNELEELEKSKSYVILHGNYHSGKEYWEAFLESASQGEPAEVVLVQFTVEGDAILYYLQYDGADYYVMEDYTRDGWSAEPGYFEGVYPYLSILETTADDDARYRDIVLSDKENLTIKLLNQYWEDEALREEMEVFWIGSYTIEE